MSLRLSWLEISGKSSIKVEDFSSEKPAWISQPAIELTPKSSIPILITWYPHAYSINITIPSWFYSHDILMIIPITKNRMWMDYFQTYPGLPPIWHHILILISHYTNKNTIMVRPQTIAKLTHLTSLAIWLLFASYLVIMVYVMVFFSHGITIVFPILFTGFAPTNIGWPEGSASEIFKGGTGRPWLIPSSKLKRLVVGLKYFERCVMTFHINWE